VKLALVASAHGFGHVTRQLAIAEELRGMGCEPTIFAAAPASLVAETLPDAQLVSATVDVGLVQQDSLTEDIEATRRLLAVRASDRAINALAERLSGFDRVVCDTAPTALEAARRAGVDALAVGNFDWAWIYRSYPELADWRQRFADWQAPHVGLELWPGPGLTGFSRVEQFGLVARHRPPHRVGPLTCLVSFGGLGLNGVDGLLPRIPGLTWVTSSPMAPLDRLDSVHIDGVAYPALVAGADLVFTKPGYGILAECFHAGTGIVWARRGAFPEAASLEAAMAIRGDLPVGADPSDPATFRLALAHAVTTRLAAGRPSPHQADGAVIVARRLLQTD
jgi:hypothetical protein